MNNKLGTLLATISIMAALGMMVLSNRPSHPTNNRDMAATTAMITNMAGNSGGTGVILKSRSFSSEILTNKHVCQVVKFGGLVSTDRVKAVVSSCQTSELHDLCLITVNENLGVNTEVAEEEPGLYSPAAVSGHPLLLPTIISRGHFSQKQIIQIMVGIRQCTKDELESPLAPICMFLGGIPEIKTYESQVVSSTIQPGNSGSAVFDRRGYIAGLVFAGQGGFGYGMIVPQSYVLNFVKNEVPNLELKLPEDDTMNKLKELTAGVKLKDTCKDGPSNINYQMVKDYCQYVTLDTIYTE